MTTGRIRPDPARAGMTVHSVCLEWDRIRTQVATAHLLTPVDITALLELRRRRSARSGDLATAVNLTPSGVSTLVERLVQAGLATRESGSDRRAVSIELTDKGARIADETLMHPSLARLVTALHAADSRSRG